MERVKKELEIPKQIWEIASFESEVTGVCTPEQFLEQIIFDHFYCVNKDKDKDKDNQEINDWLESRF